MNDNQRQQLNQFFVYTFNRILLTEERVLARKFPNISVREHHILDAVGELESTDQNTMSQIAGKLFISVGALTVAVNTLVTKGYLVRRSRENDRRIVLVELTEAGKAAAQFHGQFHRDMIEQVGEILDDRSITVLADSLGKISAFFGDHYIHTTIKEG